MIVRRVFNLAITILGCVFSFFVGAITLQQITIHEYEKGSTQIASSIADQIKHWGDLIPVARLDGQGKKECRGYDIVTGNEVGPWSPEDDGRCRLRDFIFNDFIRKLQSK